MYVVIIGGGRTGTQLSRFLMEEGHEVHVVESRRSVLALLHHEVPTESVHEGDPMDPVVLEQAGISRANVIAAVTTSDDVNLAICYLAREKYKVRRTIARVNNPRNAWLFSDLFHVDVAVNQSELMAHMIEEEMSMGDMMTLVKLRRGNYSLVEEKIPPGAKAIGIMIKDLGLTNNCIIASIIRKGEVVLPRGITALEVGDEVLAVTDPDGAEQLCDLLSAPQQAGN